MNRIVAVHRDGDGSISKYKLDDDQVLDHSAAIDAVNHGKISGVSTFTTRDGGEAIRSDRGQENYKLSDLPEF